MCIQDIGTAVRLYYANVELTNSDIRKLFGKLSNSTVTSMKKKVLEVMAERDTPRYNPHAVNTDIAYEVWGLDIVDLEKRYKKLQKLGFVPKD